MQDENIIFFLFASSIALVIIVTGFILFISLFFRAKRRVLLEKQATQLNYQKELSLAKSEIQAQTLTNIGRELHDNIGQLLAVTKIHADDIAESSPSTSATEMTHILGQTIQEVRYLSQSLNSKRLEKIGFEEAVLQEAERIRKLKGVDFTLIKKGDKSFNLDVNKSIILFRIIQEFISNTLKYSRADQIKFSIIYLPSEMKITGVDNGIGFDLIDSSSSTGTGIMNMKSRAKLIGALLSLESEIGIGTKIEITIPKELII